MIPALLLISCAPPARCPEPGHRFVPAESPEDSYTRDDKGGARCSGTYVAGNHLRAYYKIYCDCFICEPAYLGREYCVSKSELNSWYEEECPNCGFLETEQGDWSPFHVTISCDECD